jgi:hypothetical protein
MSAQRISICYSDGDVTELDTTRHEWSHEMGLLSAWGVDGEEYCVNIAWCALITIYPSVPGLTLIKKEKKVEPS